MGTQTSHCKRKEWILPLFCFIGVIIAVIIGYVLFHFRKEQMEPILRPGTFYQPKNSFFKSRFHNKHSPFKNLSYNPSMIYNGNTSSLSGLKAMDNRKNYQNLEIPINFNNGNYRNNNNNNNNYNNNATNNNYQDLDPTTYPEYDNTVEIITDDRSNINGINQMSTINSMNNVNSLNKNGMNINNIIRMNNENRINTMNSTNNSMSQNQPNNHITNYNEIPSHILSELDTTITTPTGSITETDTEQSNNIPNEYSIESSSIDYYYTGSETTTSQYTNRYYNQNNPRQSHGMISSHNQPDLNQSYIFTNPPPDPENSYIIGPTNDENINDPYVINNPNYNNNFNN